MALFRFTQTSFIHEGVRKNHTKGLIIVSLLFNLHK